MTKSSKRVHMIDEIRGFCILCMVFYHGFYTVSYVLNIKVARSLFEFFTPVEPLFAGIFVLISGLCSSFTRSNLRRGVKLLVIALLLTLVTIIFVPNMKIQFGILHMLSISMIVVGCLETVLKKVPPIVGIIVSSLLFILSYSVPNGYIGALSWKIIEIPYSFYTTDFLFPLGFPSKNFASSDYFPLIPWLFLFSVGFFVGQIMGKDRFPDTMYKMRVKFLAFLGRNSLWVYLLHQPIIYGASFLISIWGSN